MREILVLGAGQSAPYLIRYLLDNAQAGEWTVTVADRDLGQAEARVADHPRGRATTLDVGNMEARGAQIRAADLVVNLLPPGFQPQVARDCVELGRPMVSASYRHPEVVALQEDARRRGVLLLTEMGLDPGIDLMSAMSLLRRVRDRGGRAESFESFGSGVPAPDSASHPLRYAITWNPRNVVMSAEFGAQYLEEGQIKIVPWHRVFQDTWKVEVAGVGTMEAYPNRDSLAYRDSFGLEDARTVIRGTLRYPGWCETWLQVVRLGLPKEDVVIPGLCSRSCRDMVEMFLPHSVSGSNVEQRVAEFLGLSPTGRVMENLASLGLFSPEPMGCSGETPAEALIHLLRERLALPPGGRDMIIILHQLVVRLPGEDEPRRVTSTLVERGEAGGMTAMARTVGLPMGIAARLILAGRVELTGSPLPTHRELYGPILAELEREGIRFTESGLD